MKGMLISVGTGTGVEEAIAETIDSQNPDAIAFLVTESSKPTVEKAASFLRSKFRNESLAALCEQSISNGLSCVIADQDANSIDKCYSASVQALNNLIEQGALPQRTVVDFTSGTKVMSAAVVMAAVKCGCRKTSYVGGSKRNENGRVLRGTSEVYVAEPIRIKIDFATDDLVRNFNLLQFGACRTSIKELLDKFDESFLPKIAALRDMVELYDAWDKFDHTTAAGYLKQMDEFEKEWNLRLNGNRIAVKRLADAKEKAREDARQKRRKSLDLLAFTGPDILADLFANAERRANQGQYDDALARLYRLTELVAQYLLRTKYGVETSDVNKDFLKERGLLEDYEECRNRQGIIQLPLYRSYDLLLRLGEDTARLYTNDKEFRDHLTARNESILAHGFSPIGNGVYEKLRDSVKQLCIAVAGEQAFNQMLENCRFPKLKA